MLAAIRTRLSYANVIATIALFVALGGSSYAALQLPRNSVGTKQLKRNAVTAPKIKRNAVTTAKIKRNAVTTAKIKTNAVTGSKINEGTLEKIPQASAADALANLDYNSATVANPPSEPTQTGTVGSVSCDPGQRVVGGGIKVDDPVNQNIVDSYPRGTDGWQGTVWNFGAATPNFTVIVICTSAISTS
jgi:hypothetical protein